MNMPKFPLIELKKRLPKDLIVLNDYYRIQNEILRSKLPKRFDLKEHERARIAIAAMKVKNFLGQTFYSITHIYQPETILKWYRELKKQKNTQQNIPKKPGRPPIEKTTVSLILKIANDTKLSSRMIAAEMKKLGHQVSHNTVRKILIENDIDPSQQGRNRLTWKQFIMSHMDVTWACDLFTEEILTPLGLKTCYVLFFIHLGTRKIHIAGCTSNPNQSWVQQQARNFSMQLEDAPQQPCNYLICDNDTTLKALDPVLKSEDIKIVRTSFQAPWQNGYAERFVREVRETLDNMILFHSRQLDYVVKQIARYHNTLRPHQGIDYRIPLGYAYPETPAELHQVECEEILGGMLKHYYVNNAA